VNGFRHEQPWLYRINRPRLRLLFACVCFLICAVLVSDYTLNHFYRAGAYFWDSGHLAYKYAFSTSWPMLESPFLHRAPHERYVYFQIHFMPIFYVTSALHQALSFIPAAAYVSLLQGVWSGLLALSVFMMYARSYNLVLIIVATFTTAFCGPVLSTIGFPHIELAIPALFLFFLALRSAGYRISSCIALGLCLLVREDAGLHAGAALSLLAVAQWGSNEPRAVVRENVLIALICFAYSFSALTFQNLFYPAPFGYLKKVYLGDPIGSHLSLELVLHRVPVFFIDKAYVTWPLIILLAVAAWKRNAILAVGPASVLPWMLLSVLAASIFPGSLTSHYSYPVIIAIAWPSVAFSMNRARLSLQLFTSILSIVLFVSLGRWNHDDAPWRGLGVPNFGAIGTYETALRKVIARRNEFGRLMVDDAVASLVPESLMPDEWANQWAPDRLPNPDVVVYKSGARDSATTMQVIDASGLTQRCRINNTPFLIASREGSSFCN
jgi:hypothetical protein